MARLVGTRSELMWAAGLLEGEGAFYVGASTSGRAMGRIQCHMPDPDVLDRLQTVLGVGRINGPYCQTPRSIARAEAAASGLSWTYQINRQAEVARVARRLKPLMSRRRQNQIARMLEEMGELS